MNLLLRLPFTVLGFVIDRLLPPADVQVAAAERALLAFEATNECHEPAENPSAATGFKWPLAVVDEGLTDPAWVTSGPVSYMIPEMNTATAIGTDDLVGDLEFELAFTTCELTAAYRRLEKYQALVVAHGLTPPDSAEAS